MLNFNELSRYCSVFRHKLALHDYVLLITLKTTYIWPEICLVQLRMEGEMNDKEQTFFLIDGSALAYRSYYAFIRNPLINSKGENVSAVFGFAKTLLNIIDSEKPDYFAVIFDTPEPTFRHEMYEDYKAQRAAMPEDMVEQLPRIRQLMSVLKIPLITKPGYEADDIIGTLAKKAQKSGLQTVIVSGDKDLLQLVSEGIRVYNPKRSGEESEWLDAAAVKEKLGVRADEIIDYLALTGDSSDNIPGVKGVGPKGAKTLLKEFGSLDAILENIDKIRNQRVRSSLEISIDQARLSRELVTLRCDLDLETDIERLLIGEPEPDKAVEFFQELEIQSLIDRYSERKKIETDYKLVATEAELNTLIKALREAKRFAFDTETTGVNPLEAELVGLSFCSQEGTAYYVPVKAPEESRTRPLAKDKVLSLIKPLFESKETEKCAHNAKYDILVLDREGVCVNNLVFDSMIASYLINPSLRQHNLDALSLSYFNIKKIPVTDLIGTGKKQITMERVPLAKVTAYACEDADMTWRLKIHLEKKLEEMHLRQLFEDVEIPLVYTLCEMEKSGIALDIPFLEEMSGKVSEKLSQLEKKIFAVAGEEFNINSPKQLSVILFEKLKLPVVRRTKTGYSTDVNVLEELARKHELPKLLLDFRQLIKLKSTYIEALPKLVNPESGRLHTSFNQTVTATGRLSSSDPNLQNIPIRTEIGRQIRRAFIPRNREYLLFDADYSQIELRIMAHLSQDDNLSSAFRQDQDIHTRTAALIFAVDETKVTADQRRKAKEVNFGIMYGMGAYGLSQRLCITPEEADSFIKAYFVSYPRVQEYMMRITEEARRQGYVTTLLKRRRYLPEILSENRRIREFAERTAINTPIQGSAADLIKMAMIHIHERLKKERLKTKMLLQVHDELIFEVPKAELDVVKNWIPKEMEDAIELDIPIKVEYSYADNWLDAH